MKKVWITYILILLGGICCVQLIPIHTADKVNIEQTHKQNNDAEESETRISVDVYFMSTNYGHQFLI